MYIRLNISGVKSNSPDSYLQMSEIRFYAGENAVTISAISCTYDGSSPSYGSPSENEQCLIDGLSWTKMCIAFVNGHHCVLTCTVSGTPEITGFQYVTGNDSPNRDPVSWEIFVSDNGADYTQISEVSGATITDSRSAETQIFANHMPVPAPDMVIDSTNDGYPYPEGAPNIPESAMAQPYPLMLWRITEGVNEGYPYFLLQPEEPPAPVLPAKQHPYICVFPARTEVSDFATNGLAILTPTSCEVTDILRGMRSVSLVHPIDPEGRWKLLVVSNILKVDDQLYTIRSVQTSFASASGSVTVYAEDIFYQMCDGWIFPRQMQITSTGGQHAIDVIQYFTDYQARTGSFFYSFSGSSDIEEGSVIIDISSGRTPIDALLGSGGLIDQIGGELYRDKFYFSINQRMENSSDHAFDIRVGKNLTGIRRNVDLSSCVTYFRGYDGWGGWVAFAWDFEDFLVDVFPHYVVRSENFSMPEGSNEEGFDYDAWFDGQFTNDVLAFFNRNCKPIIGFEIDLYDVRSNPDFEIIAAETLRVGDKGTIYDERLGGSLTAEITETTYDAVHCRTTRVMIGDRQSFVSTAAPVLAVDFTAKEEGYNAYVTDASSGICTDASGERITEERSY
jgi:phage minor structural protein